MDVLRGNAVSQHISVIISTSAQASAKLPQSKLSISHSSSLHGSSFFALQRIPFAQSTLLASSHFEPSSIKSTHSSVTCSASSPSSSTSSSSRKTPSAKTRRLILLRHAKSSWDDPSLIDHDRPLSSRGKHGAKSIAKKLARLGWTPSLILCSDATRTRETLDIMREAEDGFAEAEARFLGSFYSVAAMDGQTARHLHETVVRLAPEFADTVMCMGHNRGWEEAASEFAGEWVELKTANAALLESKRPHADWGTAFGDGWELVKVLKPDEK
ncbi:hypothetical protein CLOM_g22632 [Closterium sp. NIES-68]|nr:hypothetical protein CLOM_g22632 [Closterium sp. NIES-68]GJP73231.1 hypothetical protein CLOP_g3976 [Closterium sp. NIES-67]